VKVKTVVSAPFEVNVHVVDLGDEALVVDASSGLDFPAVERAVRAAIDVARVRKFHLTHWHVDHVRGAAAMRRLTGVTPTIHADEARAVREGDATLTLGAAMGADQPPCDVIEVREGDAIEVGGRRFEVLLVPGHSPAHTALWEPESRALFAGDVVFEGGSFGRVDFPGCDPQALVRSIERLAALDARDLYPGHMRPVIGGAREAILESLDNARLMLEGGAW